MIYRCRKPLHVTDLVVVVSAPDEEVVVALGLPQDAGVVAGVQTGLVLGSSVGAVVALAPVHDSALQLQLDVILLDAVNLKMAKLTINCPRYCYFV